MYLSVSIFVTFLNYLTSEKLIINFINFLICVFNYFIFQYNFDYIFYGINKYKTYGLCYIFMFNHRYHF